jgi:hypothetical protein
MNGRTCAICAHPAYTLPADLGREHRAEAVPPEPNRLVTNLDPTLVQQVFDIAERQREPDVHHHGQADDFGGGLEVAKRAQFAHPRMLRPAGRWLKRVSSDNARMRHMAHVRPFMTRAPISQSHGD